MKTRRLFVLVIVVSLLMTTLNIVSKAAGSDFHVYNGVLTSYTGSDAIVNIPDYLGITAIGSFVFSNCTSLTSVTIPNSVTAIGEYAFNRCTNLTSVTIPNSVTTIGKYAFIYCINLTSVTIPGSVTSIGMGTFENCTGLILATIQNGAKSIGDFLFYNCTSLVSVIIPDSITSIGESAFDYCTDLDSVTIPNSVTSIGANAFWQCKSLTSVTIPNSVTSIGLGAFESCTSLTSITIPDELNSIEPYVFFNCTSLTSVTIPDSVTSIGNSAFGDCTSLTSVTIPDSVISIGMSAFTNCTSLTSVTISDSVTSIGGYAFNGCISLTTVTIPNNITSIGDYTFASCKSLNAVTIPDNVTSIGNYAFSNGISLKQVIIPSGVTSIGDYAFRACTSLTSVTIPDSMTSIGKSAFKDCRNLTSVIIPYGVTTISESTFEYCRTLTSVSIPGSVTNIGRLAFFGTAINIPITINEGKTLCYVPPGYTNYTIPENITKINENAFEEYTSLSLVIIPDSVTTIGNEAFYNCDGLTSVTIPKNVTFIGDLAFGNCNNLSSVYVPYTITSINDSAFSECDQLTLYGMDNTYIKSYANDKGIPFTIVLPPVITIGEYNKAPTNQDVTVIASTDSGTLNETSHTFTENGSFDFVASDAVGNITTKNVEITNIDKVAPIVTISDYSLEPTNQNITVTAITDKGTLNVTSHTFTENGSFNFVATDVAGNVITKTVTITNIDKDAPIITLNNYITDPTNQDITVSASVNEGVLNVSSHTFTENGTINFVATDEAGNVATLKVSITNIDKVVPIITIGSYSTDPTNQDITVTASTNKGTLNTTSHTFTENGSFDFIATDVAGNVTTQTVTITNIDNVLPVITLDAYNTNPTNQDVTVTASTNDGTLNVISHTFTENGSFDFIATDELGNTATMTVTITNIDKVDPIITLSNYNTDPTNKDITVTASTNDGTLNTTSYTFTENESFDFIATDAAGNVTTKTVSITNIDKIAPIITVNDYNANPTNKDITLTATTNEGVLDVTSHTFSENGSFKFTATDAAGNIATLTVIIINIDKVLPIITVDNYITDPTNQDVTVTAKSNDGALNVISHTFTENGSFDFIATDSAGNVATQTVTITNIDKVAPIITVNSYSKDPTNQDITVTATIDEGALNTTSHTFTENGNFDFIATDSAGNVATQTVTIANIDKIVPIITIDSYNTDSTNQDVSVTASTNEGTLNTTSHTFTGNGSFDFTATDAAGNVTTKKVVITNIDKVLPIITIDDYNTDPTNQDVIVTASTNDGTLNVISHTFTENGSFDFVATDEVGNVATLKVSITNIDKVVPIITIGSYNTDPTNQDITVIASTNEGTLNTTSHTFTENGSFAFIATDAAGNVTTQTVTITNINKVQVIDLGNVDWAREQIQSLVSRGVINGKSASNEGIVFAPEDQITRAELTKLIVNAFNIQGSGADASFSDVTSDSWYYNVVGAAYKNGIINGTSDETFDPEAPITRQDMATIIIRAMVKYQSKQLIDTSLINAKLSIFNDAVDIADYAKVYVATAVELGIISGTNDDGPLKFKPLDNTNRAEAAVVIYRMLDNTKISN